MNPTAAKYTVLKQICNLIPRNLVPRLARKHGVHKKARGFSPWSHVVAMLHAQLAHSLSLNDVADTMRNHSGAIATIRGASPPSRNGLSHANRVRDAAMAEELFWETLKHIQGLHPKFGLGHKYFGLPRRFKRTIYAIDSTTIQVGQHSAAKGNIHGDYLIELTGAKSGKDYPVPMRLVVATVEVDGKLKVMTFITNNMTWMSSSICDLYRCRWGIEVFFKQIKQTLQLADFLGHNENAVRWQVWMALLTYLLLRYIGHLGKWRGSFRRLFTLLRGVLFSRLEMFSVLQACGTARGSPRLIVAPGQVYLPGFEILLRAK